MTQGGGTLPLYLQVAELVVRDIAAGRLIDGERLPPEREMAAQVGGRYGHGGAVIPSPRPCNAAKTRP